MFRTQLENLGINTQNKTGTFKTKCPKCHDTHKQKNRKDLTVSVDQGWYKCHSASCGWKGKVFTDKIEYKRPKWIEKEIDLPISVIRFFDERGISQDTLKKMKITYDQGMIKFNYFRERELINYKARSVKEKKFMQFPESEKILYNLNSLKDKTKVIIVEGEMDVLALVEAGLDKEYGVVSLDQGAGAVGSRLDGKLMCLTNCAYELDTVEEFVLALDNDAPGQYTQKEIVRRLGEYRCKVVNFKESVKDANDVIMLDGLEKSAAHKTLEEYIENAENVPVPGIYTLDADMRQRMLDFYDKGWPIGQTTHFSALDDHFKWLRSDITLFTGIPGDGKGTFIRQLALIKSVKDGWKWACFVPEDFPIEMFYEDLCHAFLSQTLDKRYEGVRAKREDFEFAMSFIKDHFFCIYPMPDAKSGEFALPTNEWINKRIRFLKLKYGVNAYIKDPWNKIFHDIKQREDQYLMSEISKEKFFAAAFDAAVYVAHPTKLPKEKGGGYAPPTAYNISGGAMFFNMFDNILTIYRPNRWTSDNDKLVHVITQKIKKQKQVGRLGTTHMAYEFKENRYYQFINEDQLDQTHPLSNSSDDVIEQSAQDVLEDLPF